MKSIICALVFSLVCSNAFANNYYFSVLEIGDESCDGHCVVKKNLFITNLSNQEFMACYQASSQATNFDFIHTVAVDYQDTFISEKNWNQLKAKLNLNAQLVSSVEAEINEDESEPSFVLNEDTYLDIVFSYVQTACPDFQAVEIKEGSSIPQSTYQTLFLGGYGLFEEY